MKSVLLLSYRLWHGNFLSFYGSIRVFDKADIDFRRLGSVQQLTVERIPLFCFDFLFHVDGVHIVCQYCVEILLDGMSAIGRFCSLRDYQNGLKLPVPYLGQSNFEVGRCQTFTNNYYCPLKIF